MDGFPAVGDFGLAVESAAPVVALAFEVEALAFARESVREDLGFDTALDFAALAVAGDRTIYRQRKSGTSMMASHDPRLLIGIGAAEEAEKVTIRWPSGETTELEHIPAGSTREVVEPGEVAAAANP